MKNIELLNIIKERIEYSRLDDKSIREVLKIISEVEADIRHLIEGAIQNEKFQREHGACDELDDEDAQAHTEIKHKEDYYGFDFRPLDAKETNTWIEYGLSEFSGN